MPMPTATGGNGGILGSMRARLLADPNVVTACGRNRIRPYEVPGPDPTNSQANDPTDDSYPFIVLSLVAGKSAYESDGMLFTDFIVQVSVFGEGYWPTHFFARQVNGVLSRKKVDNDSLIPLYLRLISGIVPMKDPERSTTSKTIFHVALRYAILDTEQNAVLPYP